jgi:hypothetical protein
MLHTPFNWTRQQMVSVVTERHRNLSLNTAGRWNCGAIYAEKPTLGLGW